VTGLGVRVGGTGDVDVLWPNSSTEDELRLSFSLCFFTNTGWVN
jgi:hypothetical protein